MTDTAIKKQISEQIAALDRVTLNAIKSKKSANQYLKELGLIENNKEQKQVTKKSK